MKKLKLFLFGAVALSATSCLVDDVDPAQGLYDSPAIANFTRANNSVIIISGTTEPLEFSETVNWYTDIPVGQGDAVFNYVINTEETTLNTADYQINSTEPIVIKEGEEVADQTFDYTIFPDNISTSETSYLVIDLVKVSGGNVIGGKLVVTINKCSPPLSGTYTVVGTGSASNPTITPITCNTYRINYLPPFSDIYWFEISHNETNNTVTITDWQFEGSNPLTGSGVVNPNGSITWTGMTVQGVSWYNNLTFDFIP